MSCVQAAFIGGWEILLITVLCLALTSRWRFSGLLPEIKVQNTRTNALLPRVFVILFWIFEGLFVASEVALFCTDSPFHPGLINAVAAVAWTASFFGLVVVSFLLRRSARYLANIGWLTLGGGILIGLAFPRL